MNINYFKKVFTSMRSIENFPSFNEIFKMLNTNKIYSIILFSNKESYLIKFFLYDENNISFNIILFNSIFEKHTIEQEFIYKNDDQIRYTNSYTFKRILFKFFTNKNIKYFLSYAELETLLQGLAQ